jgi:transcriptional regulator with XRE-family HTH domain
LRLIRIAYGRAQRHAREMSQAEIARLCSISAQAWNNAETGDNRIGIDNAMKIAKRTGASLDYIYFGDTRGLPHVLAIEIGRIENIKLVRRA